MTHRRTEQRPLADHPDALPARAFSALEDADSHPTADAAPPASTPSPDRPAKGPSRRRRAPEQARQEILDAAERLVVAHGPDGVGLQAVAREAGVSHGLVTHYFGTYEALVARVLERANARLAEQVRAEFAAADPALDTATLLERFFELMREPTLVRLRAWALLSGREAMAPALQGRALRMVADALVERAARSAGGRPSPTRAQVETALLVGLGASQWYGLEHEAFAELLGAPGTPRQADARFREALGAMLAWWVGG